MDNNTLQKKMVSFILPHLGREPLLVKTIESIFKQDIGSNEIEVIVVSKAAFTKSDSLMLRLAEAGVADKVQFITIPQHKTISYGRNHGADQAIGQYLAFIDSDVRLAKDWVSTMIRLLVNEQDTILVSAVQVPDDDQNSIDVIKSSMSEANLGEVSALPGNALFISYNAFKKSDKFPEYLETCEDWVFTNSLTRLGKLRLTSESSFVHLGEDKSFSAMFFKEIWRGKSNLGSLPGRKIDLAEWPSIFVPMVVLLSLVLALVCLFLGLWFVSFLLTMFSFLAPLLYAVRLKARSSIQLNLPLLMFFYLVYFVARAVGMIKGLFGSAPPLQKKNAV